jgi:multimeric flavodoxin WrbA/putative sterol carrier protein
VKVLAINSSPRTGGQSKTQMMLDWLVEGMREEGADVNVVNIHKKKIRYCIGCYTCWTKTPGECVQKDDMSKELFPEFMESDLAVLGTPLYHFTLNANLKAFIERTLPMVQPFFVESDGVTSHPLRKEPPRIVALSVAGFPEESVFEQLTSYMNYLFRDRLVAEIYRAGAEGMARMLDSPAVQDVIDATIQGGRELARSRSISPETLARIKQPLGDFETMSPLGNLYWKTLIAEGLTPREAEKKGVVPRADSIETYLLVMKAGFNRKKAGDFAATIQYDFSGEVKGSCHLVIGDGEIQTAEGPAGHPDLTIATPFEVWMDIVGGKADGPQMLMDGKYKVDGDLSALTRMAEVFGR